MELPTYQTTAYSMIPTKNASPDCERRADDCGIWNRIKAWYLFLLHVAASAVLIFSVFSIDQKDFQIGSAPNWFITSGGLYQAQVTALISLGLVLIKLVANGGSALLAWRIIVILLEKRGITLVELTRLANWRLPIIPSRIKSNSDLGWSMWALLSIVLLWPQAFVAPLASSSVSWVPGFRVLDSTLATSVAGIDAEHANWAGVLYADWRTTNVLEAAAMTDKDPIYAFNSSSLPLRRYFNTTSFVPNASTIDITMPYFSVDLKWINATASNNSQHVGSPDFQYVNKDFGIREIGAVAIIRDEPWNQDAALSHNSTIFRDKRILGIKLRTLNFGDELPDGSIVVNTTQCPSEDTEFGKMPDVIQYQIPIGNGQEIVAYDCYMIAEASITAGSYMGKQCTVTSAANSHSPDNYATCHVPRDDDAVLDHRLTSLSIDFMSDVLKYTVLLDYVQPWISNDLDTYTSGLLALGYHAAWSGLMRNLGNMSEPAAEKVNYNPSTPVIYASISRAKLYIWFAMNLTVALSALLVFLAEGRSKRKTVRDPSLTALTIDLSGVAHNEHVKGLCNAVTLDKKDKKMPRLKWKEGPGMSCKLEFTKSYDQGEKSISKRRMHERDHAPQESQEDLV